MKRINLFPCILLVFCMMLISCKPNQTAINDTPIVSETPTAAPTKGGTPSPTPVITAEPTEEPTPKPTAVPIWPTKADLNKHDYNAIRTFLEILDENGVKNGEKLSENYDPDNPLTWGELSGEPHPDYDKDCPEFYSLVGFDWTADGRLFSVCLYESKFHDTVLRGGKLVGKLDLSGCAGLRRVYVREQNISSIDVSGCNMPTIVSVINCPELETIESGKVRIADLSVIGCPKLRQIRWLSPEWTYEEIGYYAGDDTPKSREADITLEAGNGGSIGLGCIDDCNSEFGLWTRRFAIKAVPEEGHEFLGWYDMNGKLISKELHIPIFYDAIENFDNRRIQHTALLDLMGTNKIHLIAKFK